MCAEDNRTLAELQAENEELNEQVKLLVKTERLLYSTQRQVELQLRRIRILGAFDLTALKTQEQEAIVAQIIDLVWSLFPLQAALAIAWPGPDPSSAVALVRSSSAASVSTSLPAELFASLQVKTADPVSLLPDIHPDMPEAPLFAWLNGLAPLAPWEREAKQKTHLILYSGLAPHQGRGALVALRSATISHHERVPEEADRAFLNLICRHASSALEIATLHAEERDKAREALRASEEKFRTAFNDAGIGILLLNADGEIIDYNRALRSMLGYSGNEMKTLTFMTMVHPEDVPRAARGINALQLGKQQSVVGEGRLQRKDGSWMQTLARASLIGSDPHGYQCIIVLIEDISEKRALETQLRFADRMASMGTLAAGVAHEINNPLSYIIANIEYALDNCALRDRPDDDVHRALIEANEGALRVRDIVRDLRTLARRDEKHDELVVEVVSVLESALRFARSEIRQRARLSLSLREVPPVFASPQRLGQVFLNLLINAAQAIPEGNADEHEIRVSTFVADDQRVVVEISDTGCGIAPENLARIFEPFFSTKAPGIGCGLGLSICHGIVTHLGGELRVESRKGHGATFSVILPKTARRPASAVKSPPAAKVVSRCRVLVVDDETLVLAGVRRALSPCHEVITVTSAALALEQIQKDPALDVILCDVMMPEMTGVELYERLKQTMPALAARTVFLTGGVLAPTTQEFLARTAQPCLEKPFDPHALRRLVAEVAHDLLAP